MSQQRQPDTDGQPLTSRLKLAPLPRPMSPSASRTSPTEVEAQSVPDPSTLVNSANVQPHTTVVVQPTVIIQPLSHQAGWFTRLVYFVFVGWWLSALWIGAAWFFNVLIVTLPVGLAMINKVPKIATLKDATREYQATTDGLVTRLQEVNVAQRPFWLRAVYFVFVGWGFSLIWLYLAWLCSLTLIGLPFAMWMYDRTPAVTTLRRY